MADRYLFVTGKLAAPALRETLRRAELPFDYDVAVMKITVAALMTPAWIARRLEVPPGVTRIMIPGLCEGDPDVLSEQFDIPAEKGPADLKRLPAFFGQADARSRYGARDIRVFAEINNVPRLDRERIVERGELLPRRRRRRHRPRALARPQLARRGPGGDRRPQGARLHAEHRHARSRRDPHGRRGGRGLRPQPQRAQPPRGAAAARDAGADPRHARRPRQPRRDHRAPARARQAVPRRPDHRADRLGLRREPRPLPGGAPPPPRRRDADGDRQPDRADRGRHDRASPRCCSASARSSGSATCSRPR